MTTQEFNNKFDIYYNNIAGQSNPSLDVYEKSVYLTKAQLEIVKNYYDPDSNRKKRGFEGSEKRRNDLKQLVKDYKVSSFQQNSNGINTMSRFYVVPSELFLIVNEKLKVISNDCDNNRIVNVTPFTHDEYNSQINNPFKNPDSNSAWRLNISNINNNKVVEILSVYSSVEYQLRYIKYPKPIILGNLSVIYPSENLTIDNISATTQCELDESIHEEILDRAVELALNDYQPQQLASKIQIDARNE
jgi:hypothetical protein